MQFTAAALRVAREDAAAEDGGEDDEILQFSIAGQKFETRLPSLTQIVLLSTGTDSGSVRGVLSASMEFLEGILLGDGYKRIKKLVANGTISYNLLIGGDEDNDHGIIDWIVEQVSDGRPPKRSTASSPSAKPGGPRSTGRAPGKGSILSASP